LILANKDDHITDWTGTTREASANPGSDDDMAYKAAQNTPVPPTVAASLATASVIAAIVQPASQPAEIAWNKDGNLYCRQQASADEPADRRRDGRREDGRKDKERKPRRLI